MLFAILSDIHSNFLAFEAVLKDIKKHKPDKIYCLGDIIGYGSQPNECIEALKEYDVDFIYGNHEVSLLNPVIMERFNGFAKKSLEWTMSEITDENMAYLGQYEQYFNDMPVFEEKALLRSYHKTKMVHASIPHPIQFKYIKMDAEGMDPGFLYSPSEVFKIMGDEINQLFVAHTHEPEIYSNEKGRKFDSNTLWNPRITGKVKLHKNHQYIINVGSVGQPRDRDTRACYALYDTQTKDLDIRRIPYDFELAHYLIIAKGLPEYLGKRLLVGK